jgi:hypothetical protein
MSSGGLTSIYGKAVGAGGSTLLSKKSANVIDYVKLFDFESALKQTEVNCV